MSYKWILDDLGNPIPEPDLVKWAKWFENSNEQRMAALNVIGEFIISTVFLGLDHAIGGPVPILYESMVFKDGVEYCDYTRRYHTKDQALAGHDEIVKAIENMEIRQTT